MTSGLNITYSTLTDQGERAVNEDYLDVSITPGRQGFILCDGLGGHGCGDTASQLVAGKIREALEKSKSLEESILYAQEELILKQKQENEEDSMKTTAAVLLIQGNTARFAHVGDSRIYCFEKARYVLRSQDHSVPQMLVKRGDIREKDIRHHEDRNRLLRVMGVEWESPKYEMSDPMAITGRTSFLLCSDGFWELIEERQMCKALKKSKTPREWLENMEQVVLENGRGTNMDNYSAIAVFIRD